MGWWNMRTINNAEFQKEYDKVTSSADYMVDVRKLDIGTSVAIPCVNKDDALRKRHSVINEAYMQREKGNTRKFQTIVKDKEVWVRRVE